MHKTLYDILVNVIPAIMVAQLLCVDITSRTPICMMAHKYISVKDLLSFSEICKQINVASYQENIMTNVVEIIIINKEKLMMLDALL